MKKLITPLSLFGLLFTQLAMGLEPSLLKGTQVGDDIQSNKQNFKLVSFPYKFQNPWAVAFLPDGKILVTELSGKLLLIEKNKTIQVKGLPKIETGGQGGLMDVILHPQFEQNKRIYMTFAAPSEDGQGSSTAVYMANLQINANGTAELINGKTIWKVPQSSSSGLQFGSRMAIDKDNYLFISTGDRRAGEKARDLSDGRGKVIRLHDDGSIPSDNPYVGATNALAEIWTSGHRNSQGLTINPTDGVLWETEHGPHGGDELNIIVKGSDYGWMTVTWGRDYSGELINGGLRTAPGITDPILYWETPEDASVDVESPHSIAPSGLAVAYQSKYAGWEGNIFSGALAGEQLRRVEIQNNKAIDQEVLLDGVIGRIRDVRMGPDGYLYLLNNGYPSALYRLEPVTP